MNPSPTNFIDESAKIGERTTVWHFATVLANVIIGTDCSIGSHTEIGHGSIIGHHSRIGAHVFLPPNSKIGERVFIAPGVVCCDDRWPQAGNSSYLAEPPIIESDVAIGAGSVLLPGVRIGKNSTIGAGSVIARDVPSGSVVRGEPARVRRRTHFDIYAPSVFGADDLIADPNESHLQMP